MQASSQAGDTAAGLSQAWGSGGSAAGNSAASQQLSQQLSQQQSQRLLQLQQNRSLKERSSAPTPNAQRLLQHQLSAASSSGNGRTSRQLSLPSYARSLSGASQAAAAAAVAAAGGGGVGMGLPQGSMHAPGGVFLTQASLYGAAPSPGEVLTGALPLEALPALRVGKAHRHQSFMLQAIKDQVGFLRLLTRLFVCLLELLQLKSGEVALRGGGWAGGVGAS
jgi:hypothetical protein